MDTLEPPPLALETKRERPLLPPVLLGPAAILWLWALPLVILLALNLQGYWLVEGNMDANQRGNAHVLGLAGLVNLFAGIALFVVIRRRGLREPDATSTQAAWWGAPALVVQAGYLWLAMSMSGNELLPRSVTEWIYPQQRFLYNQFSFAMPALFWGMLRLACARPAKGRARALVFNLVLAVAAPAFLYVLFRVFCSTGGLGDVGPYVFAVLIIGLGVLMFVATIRGLALGLRDIDAWKPTAERIAILIFALVLPVAGLLLNRTIPFPNDFQAWEVYTLTTANAAILLLASCWHARRPLLSLGLLCATLPFTLYFFVVFLPFLPLSILAVIALGAGFLVLTPTVLLILHLGLLNKARRGSSGRRLLTGVLCFLLLPGFFTVRGLADKAALNAALDHVYAPSITAGPIMYPASRDNLRRALSNHRSYKNGIYYPLLSDYYAWLVFDHLVLPDDKLARLEKVFFGATGSTENIDPVKGTRADFFGDRSRSSVRDRNRMPRAPAPARTVVLDDLDVRVTPADGDTTTVTLAFTLRNTGSVNAEYVQPLPLPAGVFVSGFRLHINGGAVPGRITEKKTALWVYSMIRDSDRRDPGLLFYNTPEELELRVFPVVAGTPSVVEIDFLISSEAAEASDLRDAKQVEQVFSRLTNLAGPRFLRTDRGGVVAGGLDGRSGLPTVPRDEYLHVIVDRSVETGFTGDLPTALLRMRERFPSTRFARVTLANYDTVELESETASLDDGLPVRGGFVPDLALAQALRKHRDVDLDAEMADGPPARPIFVILSRRSAAVAPELTVAKAWADVVPSLEIYGLDKMGVWTEWPVVGRAEAPLLRLGKSIRPHVAGRMVRFKMGSPESTNKEARVEYWSSHALAWQPYRAAVARPGDTPWTRAVGLQMAQHDYERNAADAGVDLKDLVKASRETGVMLASTSYIVVENSAQWRMLDVSERQKLGQNAALNFKEAPAPSTWCVILAFGLWLAVRRRRARAEVKD